MIIHTSSLQRFSFGHPESQLLYQEQVNKIVIVKPIYQPYLH